MPGKDTATLNRGSGKSHKNGIFEQSLKQVKEEGLQVFGAKANGKVLGV